MTGFQSKPVTMQQLQGIIRAVETGDAPSEKSDAGQPETGTAFEARRAEIIEALGEEIFNELLSSFFDDAANLLRDLHAALAVNDYRNTDSLLHTLKGAASSVGFSDLADRSHKLRQTSITETTLTELQDMITHHRQRHVA